jgi:hypothetical protein
MAPQLLGGGVARACVAGARLSLYGKLLFLAVCILLMANCHKHSVKQFPARLPPPAEAADSPTPLSATRPSLSDGEPTQANPKAANKVASKSPDIAHAKSQPEASAAVNFRAQPNLPVGSLDVKVRVKSAVGGWTTINLATAIRDALDACTPSGFIFECPVRMRVGSPEKVRLTTRQNLNDLLRQKLEERGIPAEYLNGIITLAVADLTSPTDSSFAIRPEKPAAGHSSDTWVWRVEARQPGNHKLELKVTLSAGIPSRRGVEAHAAMLSRIVAVDADPFYPYLIFFYRYWLEMAGSVAGLMGAWLIWMLWRTRRTAFSHR